MQTSKLKSLVLGSLALIGIFTASPLSAATFTPDSGSIVASIFVANAGGVFYDVRGAAAVSVFDGATLVGQSLLSDPTGDPNMPFGNSTLVFTTPGFEFGTLPLDTSNPFLNGTTLLLAGNVQIQPATLDPSLLVLGAGNPLLLAFELTGATPQTDGILFSYIFTGGTTIGGGAVPEPASFALIAIGGIALAISKRYRRA